MFCINDTIYCFLITYLLLDTINFARPRICLSEAMQTVVLGTRQLCAVIALVPPDRCNDLPPSLSSHPPFKDVASWVINDNNYDAMTTGCSLFPSIFNAPSSLRISSSPLLLICLLLPPSPCATVLDRQAGPHYRDRL
jgi:hypothetical protein